MPKMIPVITRTKWRHETTRYASRIVALSVVTKAVTAELKRFPGLLSFAPQAQIAVKHGGIIYANQMLGSSVEVLRSTQLLWPEGHFLCAAHCVRLLYEICGGLRYFQLKVLKRSLESEEAAKAADEKLQRLLLGTNSGPLLPAGIEGRLDVINVMEFVRAGEAYKAGFEAEYKFLCDISHPTYMHMSLNVLTMDFSWSNDLFATEIHRILERITKAAEDAVSGITAAIIEVYRECVPGIERAIADDAARKAEEGEGEGEDQG